ncbi:MAG: MmcQ/YjbR family DNA-binding protein [Bacteroidetes bacterium]|nr:MmcQ/YjbR family DNA-binding protein [Bacteroidota bacterium]
MTLDDIRTYCRSKPGHITEGTPFGDDVLVFKVKGKIFLLANLVRIPFQINLKAEPEQAVEWRERYEGVTPGYHMNKRHWNTVVLDGSVPAAEIYRMIDHSHELVAPAGRGRPQRRGRTTGPRTMARTRSSRSSGRKR